MSLENLLLSYMDFNPWDNDIKFDEERYIRNLIKSEPDEEWDGESEPPNNYRPEGDDYVQYP